jgi:hypothetical protein
MQLMDCADVSALAGDIAPDLTHNKAAVSVELFVVGHLNVALQADSDRAGILLTGDAGVGVGPFNQMASEKEPDGIQGVWLAFSSGCRS